jgi:hypothetical protein
LGNGVAVGVRVIVGVNVRVIVGVDVRVNVGVGVLIDVGVGVSVCVAVGTFVSVGDGIPANVCGSADGVDVGAGLTLAHPMTSNNATNTRLDIIVR